MSGVFLISRVGNGFREKEHEPEGQMPFSSRRRTALSSQGDQSL